MEVASPLPLGQTRAGAKRSFCPSPFLNKPESSPFPVASVDSSMGIDEGSGFGNQPFKRRRFADTKMETCKAPFPIFASPSSASVSQMNSNSLAGNLHSSKRSRTENGWNQVHAKQQIERELQKIVDQQAAEITRLKSEKENVEKHFTEVKCHYDKISGENRILKKAVTIQQERQNQAAHEIGAANRYRVDAEERIRRLEQMNLNLQYRLQSQGSCNDNSFMGFNPRPPDVY